MQGGKKGEAGRLDFINLRIVEIDSDSFVLFQVTAFEIHVLDAAVMSMEKELNNSIGHGGVPVSEAVKLVLELLGAEARIRSDDRLDEYSNTFRH